MQLNEQILKRNYGIDLLRILSMIMIVTYHILLHGGILSNSEPYSLHNSLAWLLEIAATCAVNMYALISGYVGYGRKHRTANIIYLYFQVIFYTVLTTGIFMILKPELVGAKMIIQAVFPFAYDDVYWYFSSYFCLFFFMPALNLMLDKFEKGTMQKLVIGLFIIYSILPTLFHSDFGKTNKGYSSLWLAVLYLAGAYIKKYGVPFRYKKWKNLLGYAGCVVITWGVKIGIELAADKVLHTTKDGNLLGSYTSPTIVLCAVFLLLFFEKLECGKLLTKWIQFFAPLSFGVYLFHEEPLIRKTFMAGRFSGYLTLNPVVMIIAVIGTALGIWLFASMIDKVRLMLFELLKIKQLSRRIAEKIEEKTRKAVD